MPSVNFPSHVRRRHSYKDCLNWQSMVTLLHPQHCPHYLLTSIFVPLASFHLFPQNSATTGSSKWLHLITGHSWRKYQREREKGRRRRKVYERVTNISSSALCQIVYKDCLELINGYIITSPALLTVIYIAYLSLSPTEFHLFPQNSEALGSSEWLPHLCSC